MNDPGALRLNDLVTRVTLRAGAGNAFATWQAELTRLASATPGFASIEIAAAADSRWTIIQRFRSQETRALWQSSPSRAQLFANLARMTEPGTDALLDDRAPDPLSSYVTEVITTTVQPGQEQAHLAWAEKIQTAQATFSGYMGTMVQAPVPPEIPFWTALVRFATSRQLEAWLASDERKALLRGTNSKISKWSSWRASDPFGVWFAAPQDGSAHPPAWKQAALVLLVLFPVVMLEIQFLSPFLVGRHPAIATFIGNAVSVALTSWPLMPLAVSSMRWWLRPAARHRRSIEIVGASTLVALYAIELAIFVSLY